MVLTHSSRTNHEKNNIHTTLSLNTSFIIYLKTSGAHISVFFVLWLIKILTIPKRDMSPRFVEAASCYIAHIALGSNNKTCCYRITLHVKLWISHTAESVHCYWHWMWLCIYFLSSWWPRFLVPQSFLSFNTGRKVATPCYGHILFHPEFQNLLLKLFYTLFHSIHNLLLYNNLGNWKSEQKTLWRSQIKV